MSVYVLKMFVISLVLTLALELAVFACVQRSLTLKTAWLVVLVNLLTNPAAVWIVWVASLFWGAGTARIVEVLVEALVFCTEAWIYLMFSREAAWNIKRPILTACVVNMVSWGIGLILSSLL